MKTEMPVGPWSQYPCDSCDNPAVSLAKVDGGWELQCIDHAGWEAWLAQYPDRDAEIRRMQAAGADSGAVAAFATLHIKRASALGQRDRPRPTTSS